MAEVGDVSALEKEDSELGFMSESELAVALTVSANIFVSKITTVCNNHVSKLSSVSFFHFCTLIFFSVLLTISIMSHWVTVRCLMSAH